MKEIEDQINGTLVLHITHEYYSSRERKEKI